MSASTATDIGRLAPGPRHNSSASSRSSSQSRSAAFSCTSHDVATHRRLHSGLSISAISGRDSITSIRRATRSRYARGQCAGISVTGVDPCRANHSVLASHAATRRARTISNARSPNFSGGSTSADAVRSSSSSPYSPYTSQSNSSCTEIISQRSKSYSL